MEKILVELKSRQMIAENTLLCAFECRESFSFLPGQFIQIIIPAGKRYFCLVNSPRQAPAISIAMRQGRSEFKKALQAAPLGGQIEITGPWGEMSLPKSFDAPLVFIAGGIGITPFMSMIRHVRDNKLPYQITLLYSNPTKKQTAFFDELVALSLAATTLKIHFTMTDEPWWAGDQSLIDSKFIKRYIPDLMKSMYFIVGPPQMVNQVVNELADLGIDQSQIRSERFNGY